MEKFLPRVYCSCRGGGKGEDGETGKRVLQKKGGREAKSDFFPGPVSAFQETVYVRNFRKCKSFSPLPLFLFKCRQTDDKCTYSGRLYKKK